MTHDLPTPVELSKQITLLIAEKAKCSASWEQHKHSLGAAEFLIIRTAVVNLLDGLLDRHLAEAGK